MTEVMIVTKGLGQDIIYLGLAKNPIKYEIVRNYMQKVSRFNMSLHLPLKVTTTYYGDKNSPQLSSSDMYYDNIKKINMQILNTNISGLPFITAMIGDNYEDGKKIFNQMEELGYVTRNKPHVGNSVTDFLKYCEDSLDRNIDETPDELIEEFKNNDINGLIHLLHAAGYMVYR